MTETQVLTALWTGVFLLMHLAVIARVILRPHREPASRIAWIVVIIVFPVIGILAYILLGETNIGRRRVSRICAVLAEMPDLTKAPGMDSPKLQPKIPETYAHLFRLGYSVNGFEPVGGNCATLLPDSNASVDSMVADIDASQDHVHLIFYIWLPDNNGLKVVGGAETGRHTPGRLPGDGRWIGLTPHDQIPPLESHAGRGHSGGYRPGHRQSSLASVARTHRFAESSQDSGG